MHIKQKAEDFRVEEVTDIQAGREGDYAFYRLEKRGWTTLDALKIIQRRWKMDARRVAFGGLKDRHAETVQYLTIYRGPQRKLTHPNLQVAYLGQVPAAYDSEHIQANRFEVTVRALTSEQTAGALSAAEEVRQVGAPNYFDDQRFGSVTHGGPFLAQQLIVGKYEAALKSALIAPYAFERAPQKKQKALLRQHWGDWGACQKILPERGEVRRIIDYLAAHATDYPGALERLRPELRTLYLSAYQSHLWNRMVARWLLEHFRPQDLLTIGLQLGEVPMPRRLNEEQRQELGALHFPLHSARIHLEEDDPRKSYFDRILAEEGLTQDQFKLKGFHELFFSKGERAAWCFPRDLTAKAAGDEAHPGRRKLTLRFELPRGSYATLLVKRIARSAK